MSESEVTLKVKSLDELQELAEHKVALLNRMIRQHPKSPTLMSWVDLKEFLEQEILGYEVNYEM